MDRHEMYLGGLYDYVRKLVDIAVEDNKEFIIWGYAKGGAFIKYLIEQVSAEIRIAYIIDSKVDISPDHF